MALDLNLTLYLNGLTGHWPIFDYFIIFLASYFQYIIVLALFVVLYYSTRPNSEKVKIFLTSIVAAAVARLGLAELIRLFYHRLRPFLAYPDKINPLLADYDPSFPSGHTIFFFAFSMVVYKYNRKWGLWSFGASFFIGISRVIAGVHYPSDILGGVILGIVVGYLVYLIAERKSKTSSATVETAKL